MILDEQTYFAAYLWDVKSQLYCNASEEYHEKYITYDYSEEEVDSHLDYFRECMRKGLSGYKALLFFDDYLGSLDNQQN